MFDKKKKHKETVEEFDWEILPANTSLAEVKASVEVKKKKPKRTTITGWVKLVGENKVQELKAAAFPPTGKPLWLYKYLDDEQIAEIFFRIFEREEPLKAIAKCVRDQWGIQKHWPLQNFTRGMDRWIDILKNDYYDVLLNPRVPDKIKKKAKKEKKEAYKLFEKLDILGRLGYAIELQTDRLNMIHNFEKKAKHVQKHTDVIATNLSKMAMRYVDIAVKTGVLSGVPSEVNVNLQGKAEFVHAEFIAGDATKWVKAAQDFLSLAEKKAINMGKGKRGEAYRMIEANESDTEIDTE